MAGWHNVWLQSITLLYISPSAKVSPCTRLFCHRRFQRGSHNHVSQTEVSLGKLAPPPPKSLIALTGSDIFLANTLSGCHREVSPYARRAQDFTERK